MEFLSMESEDQRITRLTCESSDHRLQLRWHWPRDIHSVFIYRSPEDLPLDTEAIGPGQLKLFTKEEYKAAGGYEERVDRIDRYRYYVFPCVELEGRMIPVLQHDGSNAIAVSTGKAKIYYSIKQKTGLFQKYKTLVITIRSELPLRKDVLCYVKKRGGYPLAKDDGTLFPFIQDFEPGRTVLPPIEVDKNDFVRLFFTDGKAFGQVFELIPE